MSLPAQNLHEFVLTLLNDEAARSAFTADPTSALAAAGLSDVTPQDVQEVAPLVADYAPAPLAEALSALPLDADVTDLQGAIAQLQAVAGVADGLPTDALPLDVPARADLPVSTDLPVDTSTLPLASELLGGPTAHVLPELGDLGLPALGDLPLGTDGLPLGALPLDTARADLPVNALPIDIDNLPVDALPIEAPEPGEMPSLPEVGDLPVGLPELSLGDLPLDVPATEALPLDAARADLPVNALPVSELPLDALPLDVPELDGLGLPALGDLPLGTDTLPTDALPLDVLPTDGLPLDAARADLPVEAPVLPVETPDLSDLPVSLPEVEGLAGALPGLPVEPPALGELPSLPTISTERADVPSELTGGLPVDTGAVAGVTDVLGLNDVPDTGILPVDFDDLGSLPVDAPSLGDAPFTAPDLDVPGVGRVDSASEGSADGYATTVSYEGELAEGAAAAAAATDGAGVAGAAASPAGAFVGSAAGSAEGVTGGFALESDQGELQSGLTAEDDAVLAGARSDSALGTYTLGFDGLPADVPSFDEAGDLAGSLDSEVLGRAEPAAGPIADYVSIGGDLAGSKIAEGSATLGQYLTEGSSQLGDAVTEAGAYTGAAVSDGGHHAAALASDLPAAPGVPSVLPAEVPTEIPAAAPADLPVHAHADLPQSLPHLPVANPLPEVTDHVEHTLSTDPVKEVVSVTDSPLTDTLGPLNHAPLPEVADLDNLHGDLPLGH